MRYLSISRATGEPIDDAAHISQSIQDILTTPRGSRIMRREYGSDLFELIDQPQSPALTLQIMAATVIALSTWEPRIRISSLQIEPAPAAAKLEIRLTVERIDGSRPSVENYRVTV